VVNTWDHASNLQCGEWLLAMCGKYDLLRNQDLNLLPPSPETVILSLVLWKFMGCAQI